jgi:arylsulfatase A-like enzyme
MNRRDFIKYAAITLGFTSLNSGTAKPTDQPNILWIIAEDMSPDLGCYGNNLVETPHIDLLAGEGTRFTHAFSPSSVCVPSRSSFITGMYATSIGAHHQMLTQPSYSAHFGHGDNLPNNNVWLPEPVEPITWLFQRTGYYTVNVVDRKIGCNGKKHYNFNVKQPVWESKAWSDLKSHQPFYGQVNFYQTHRVGIRGIKTPETRRFSGQSKIDPDKVELPPYYPDLPAIRADRASYLDCVCALDEKVGRVIDQLKNDGLWENTIVFFFSDHGRPMPREKMWLYDGSLRVPLIVRVPEKWRDRFPVQSHAVYDRLVCLIDLAATSLDMAGLSKPDWMEGRILFGSNREPDRDYVFGTRDNLVTVRMRNRTVRTRRYRYIRNFSPEVAYKDIDRVAMEIACPHWLYLRLLQDKGQLTPEQENMLTDRLPEEELYDLKKDPYEIHNLANDPAHAEQLDRLRKVLEEWIETSGDRGAEPTDPELIKIGYHWEQGLRELYNQSYYEPLKKRGLPVLPFDEIAISSNKVR